MTKKKKTNVTSRINISVTDQDKIDVIDEAVEALEEDSRSGYMIDASYQKALNDLKRVGSKQTCEVCDKKISGDHVWSWRRHRKYKVGKVVCEKCVDSINELPDEIVLGGLKEKR